MKKLCCRQLFKAHSGFLVIAMVFVLMSGHARAASFDCNLASTETEIEICDSAQLSAYDELLSAVYGLATEDQNLRSTVVTEQRLWIAQRDKVLDEFTPENGFYSGHDQLLSFMSARVYELLEYLNGASYEAINTLFSDVDGLSIQNDSHRRIILFSPSNETFQTYSNILFFDTSNQLAKAIRGDIYGYQSPCEDTFAIEPTSTNSDEQLVYIASCGVGGRHGWSETIFTVDSSCIGLEQKSISSGSSIPRSNNYFIFTGGSDICLEQNEFNFASVVNASAGIDTAAYHPPQALLNSADFLRVIADYWLQPYFIELQPINRLHDQCETNPVALTRLRIIEFYSLFTQLSDTSSNIGLGVYQRSSPLGIDIFDWDYQFSSYIDLYEDNKHFFNLLLPLVKMLDTEGNIKATVEYLIEVRDNPELIIPRFAEGIEEGFNEPCTGPYFEIYSENATILGSISNPDFIPNSQRQTFWERREADGTAGATLDILLQVQEALE